MSNQLSTSSYSLEGDLKQSIQELHTALFNHPISEVTCQLVTEGVVTVVLENTTTLPEKRLVEGGCNHTASILRQHLIRIFEARLKILFSEEYQRSVEDILSQYQADTGRMSLMIIQK